MAKKFGLGKGVDAVFASEPEDSSSDFDSAANLSSSAILGDESEKKSTGVKIKTSLPEGITADENGTLWVNPLLLKPNPRQPRQFFDEAKLAELTESVRQEGVLSPIIIEDANDGTFFIIAGERRTRAARAAGLEKVPVQLRKYSEERKLEVALIENIQREDLNPVEEAQAYYKLMEISGITQEQVAQRVGKDRSTVANCLRLLKLPEDMQRSLAQGSLTSGHARALLSVVNPTDQRILFGKIVGQGMSVRQAEQIAQEYNGKKSAKITDSNALKKDNRDPNFIEIEHKLIETLGTKVQMKGNFDKGSITIDYFSKDDFEKIYNIITK